MINTFTTSNRQLENFFYSHDIFFLRHYKGEDLQTVWVYEDTPYLRQILEEYKTVVSRRQHRTV